MVIGERVTQKSNRLAVFLGRLAQREDEGGAGDDQVRMSQRFQRVFHLHLVPRIRIGRPSRRGGAVRRVRRHAVKYLIGGDGDEATAV
eukprot:ctg_3367.g422